MANDQGLEEGLLIDTIKYPERQHLTRIPYGYKKGGDPNLGEVPPLGTNGSVLIPDPAVIPFLDQALDQLDAGIALRVVTEWLNNNTPEQVSLSHSGLQKLRDYYRPNYIRIKPKSMKRLSPDEKAAKKRRMLIAQEKKKIKNAIKRQARLGEELEIIRDNTVDAKDRSLLLELDYSSPEYQEIKDEVPVVFKPNPGPQTLFFAAEEQEVLYGGAAGGGKSYALIADPMRYFENKHFRGLILRRTNDELRELIWKSQELYPQIWKDAIWREKDKEWRFPSGARLWMTYLERDEDVMRYHGQAFTYIGIDELTQYATPFAWNFMRSRLRDASSTLPLFMRATSNPGGPGHGWVKRMFVDPAPKGEAFWATDVETGETLAFPKDHPTKANQPLFKRRFIPARVSDNPYIWNDGNYEANLMALPEGQRKQLLLGDWSVSDGAAFSEFREHIHTCKPFKIPEGWRKFRSCDFGYSTFSAVHWYAIDPNNTLYVYRELYVSKKTGRDLAKLVLEAEEEKVTYGVLDSSVWAMRGQTGPSIAEEMISLGCNWRPSDRTPGSRIAGKNRLHELLKVDDTYFKPGIIFFNTCRQIISDLPMIPMDPKGSEDIDDRYTSDHAYDSIRYGIMSRPRANDLLSVKDFKRSSYSPSDQTFGY